MKRFLATLLCIMLLFTTSIAIGCGGSEGAVSVKYYEKAPDMLSALKAGQLSIGVLPEPAATQLVSTSPDKTWYRLDVQELYDSESKSYPQAVMMVKQSLLNTCPDLVPNISNAFSSNLEWVKSNPALAVRTINEKIDGFTPSLNEKAITSEVVDRCKIYWQSASDSKVQVQNYLADIISVDAQSAKTVADDFFYTGESSGVFTEETVKVAVPDGAPALAIAKFIYDVKTFDSNKTFEYKVVASGDIATHMQRGDSDIIVMPVNAASKLYEKNSSDTYKLVSVVTHGNLYIMSTEKINSISDLKGETVGSIGMGLVPDLTFRSILSKNNIEYQVAI